MTDLLEIDHRLREIHRTIKRLYGERFSERVAEYEPQLIARAAKENCTPTAAAIHWANEPETDPRLALLLLAVAMEIILAANGTA